MEEGGKEEKSICVFNTEETVGAGQDVKKRMKIFEKGKKN